MPATFPAHPGAVLPLKLWRPAWFDGLALSVGSMAPDLAYALDGSLFERPFPGLAPLWQIGHSLPWFFAWALPVTFALCLLLRLAAPAFATHLPAAPPSTPAATATALFRSPRRLVARLRAAVGLARHRPRWYVTVFSACIGAFSHVVWDRVAVGPLDLASSLVGGLICLWLLHRLMRQRSGADPATIESVGGTVIGSRRDGRRPVLYWGTFAAVLAAGGTTLPSLPGYFLPHTMSARVILLSVGAVVVASAATAGVSKLRVGGGRGESLQQ